MHFVNLKFNFDIDLPLDDPRVNPVHEILVCASDLLEQLGLVMATDDSMRRLLMSSNNSKHFDTRETASAILEELRKRHANSVLERQVTKSVMEQIHINGLHELALLDMLIKKATARQCELKSEINQVAFEKFVSLAGVDDRPVGFEIIDKSSTGTVEFRLRSAGSVLTDEEVTILGRVGIHPRTKVIQPHMFSINYKYADDIDLLKKVEKALSKIVPKDFIVQQQEVSRKVVRPDMLDAAFYKGAKAPVLSILCTLALRPKLGESYNMDNLIKDALEVMQP